MPSNFILSILGGIQNLIGDSSEQTVLHLKLTLTLKLAML